MKLEKMINTVNSIIAEGKGILAMEIWKGNAENARAAQSELYERARCNHLARIGRLDSWNDKSVCKNRMV